MKSYQRSLGLAFVLAAMVGCSSNDTKDTSGSAADDAAAAAAAEQAAAEQAAADKAAAEAEAAILDTVFYFDFDQSVLKSDSRVALTAWAERLKAAPRNVRLEGHADERGTREYNMALGERRANAVRDFMVLQGVESSSIEVVSYGEERPAKYGSSETSWAANRRVELK